MVTKRGYGTASDVRVCRQLSAGGRKCVFCGSFKINRTRRGYSQVMRQPIGQHLLLEPLQDRDLAPKFREALLPSTGAAFNLDLKVIGRVYQKLRTALFHVAELEGMASNLSGEIELDEAYFGGRRTGRRLARGAAGKSVVFGLLERDGRVYTKVVEHVSADTLMAHIQTTTRKGSVYDTDAFRGYQSLRR